MNDEMMTNEEMERALARSLRQAKLVDKIRELVDEVNGGSERELADAIVEALRRSHRTLQQSFMGAVRLAITDYAKAGHDFDLRNAEAVKWAGQVAALPNSDIRFPRI